MRRAAVFSGKTNRWELMSANIKPHLEAMPFLQEVVTGLDEVITEAKALDSLQEQNRQKLTDVTHRRQDLERRGEVLLTRIIAHLKGSFGYTSDDLIQFGLTPRPRTVRRQKKADKAAAKPPAAQ
jgi:hypothetical protein